MKKFLRILLLVIILGGFVWTIYFLYKKSQKLPDVFAIESPFISNIERKTVATGKVVPRIEIEIKPQVSGIVQKIYVEEGKMIREGDLIARVKIIPNMISLNEAEYRLETARNNFEDAGKNFSRQKKMFDQGVIPEAEFQKYELEYLNSKEELQAANNNLQLIKEGVTSKSDETTNTLIRSTISGMVLDIPVEEGNSVIETNTFSEGTTIAYVANMQEMIFEGKVDETEVGKIKPGMILSITIGAIDNVRFDAVLEFIAPKGVEENGAIQFEIKAALKLDENYFVRSGYSANADIILEKRDSVIVIPESLIKFENDSTFIEIEVSKQVFEKRFIITGLSDGINIEVLEGVSLEDKIKSRKITE
ncbi:MAG: efflux RND transporter periplasmic adaptor subunit [Bacteroidales bacterium]|nr:efflux RND transporter periplasmic adaptor subunit [Bacteroidales bacterium]MCF8389444.1 efflux RND transporter periplasmic adaptor subunit [Bacteroidales bacterium]